MCRAPACPKSGARLRICWRVGLALTATHDTPRTDRKRRNNQCRSPQATSPPTPPPSSEPTSGSSRRCSSSTSAIRTACAPEWVRYFQSNGHANGTTGTDRRPAGTPAGPGSGAPEKAPEKAAEAKREAGAAKQEAEAGGRSRSRAGARRPPPRSPSRAKPRAAAEPRRRAPAHRSPRTPSRRESPRPRTSRPTPCCAAPPPRTVQNMDASLSVPTATSVRSVPVKLLWDNRTVINNHLARARGGKVSFTHIIGYALVKALRAMPEMNVGYDEQSTASPTWSRPAHINLGLAIDMKKPDGTRQLLVPSIKAAETMDFAGVLDRLRGDGPQGPRQQAHGRGLPGHDASRLTNPGGIGTVHSVPRLMKGQGAIIGVGAMEYPPELAGRLRGGDRPQRHQQGHDADLDVRPPRHPGRPVRRVPQARPRAAARRGRTSTTRSSARSGSPTSRSAGRRTSRPPTTTRSASRPGSSS